MEKQYGPRRRVVTLRIEREIYYWEQIDRAHLLDRLHEIIGCDCVENVRTVLEDICLIVDECGRIKCPPQPHNDVASKLYLGWILGKDDIVGPAVVAAIHPVNGESDWVPLNHEELATQNRFIAEISLYFFL